MQTANLPAALPFAPLHFLRFARDAPAFFEEAAARCGDPFTMYLPQGPLVVTGNPEGIREIFTADHAVFEPFGQLPLEPVLGKHSLLLLFGERHRRERKLLMPPFHGERMRAYGRIIQDITMRKAAAIGVGERVKAQDLTTAISLEVIIEAVFGVEDPARVALFRDVIANYLDSYTPPLMAFTPLRRSFGGLGPWARFQRYGQQFQALIAEEIERRRKSQAPREDILSLLLEARDEAGEPMTEQEIHDELRTLLVAGHETTALSMAWAIDAILRDSHVRERLRDELVALGPLPSPEALAKSPYLSAICDETLRFRPILVMITRKLVAPFTLLGREIPPGVGLAAGIAMVHRNPAIYQDPYTFRPERFLERKFSPFEYLPFGGGPRRCLGAAFALFEMKVALGTLLAMHRFELVNSEPPRAVRRNVTVGPGDGVPLLHIGPIHGARA
jgi:cytochrome P450